MSNEHELSDGEIIALRKSSKGAPDVNWSDSIAFARAVIASALAKRDVASPDARDAERYRWLRNFRNLSHVDAMLDTTDFNTLDAAVDAAIAAHKGE